MASIDYSIKKLDKVVKFDGKVKNAEVSRLTAPGENYMSLVFRVDIEVEKDGHSKIVNSVAKCLPMDTKKPGKEFHEVAMKNEIIWYSELVPLIKEFGEQNGVPVTYIPEYFGSRFSLDSSKNELDGDAVLLLENLVPKGYKNYDRRIGSDFSTTKAILKQLAVFHALPIVIKKKKPELFEVIKDFLEKCRPKSFGGAEFENHGGPPGPPKIGKPGAPPGPPDSDGTPAAKKPSHIMFDLLANKQEFAPYISKLKPVFDKPLMGVSILNNMAKEPWNTITHNDFWVNNVMVNLKEGKETLVKIVDYQMCVYGSFTRDIVFFLLTSVNNDVLKAHLDDLLRFYYEEFTSVLRKGKVDLELSYAEYLEEIRNSAAESEVGHAIFFSLMILANKEEAAKAPEEMGDPLNRIINMIKNMNQIQKERLLLIASESIKRNWI